MYICARKESNRGACRRGLEREKQEPGSSSRSTTNTFPFNCITEVYTELEGGDHDEDSVEVESVLEWQVWL